MSHQPPVEILVEELSAERALRVLLPKMVPGVDFEIRVFQGKTDLLKKLPQRMKGYAAWPGVHVARLVVLVDRDDDDCVLLRSRLDEIAETAGFRSRGSDRTVLNRIAVEELEAWFIGDMSAVAAAYPRVRPSNAAKKAFRDPDSVQGGTWEALERLLQGCGYHQGGLPKVAAATEIARAMNVDHNRSRSFQVFRDGLRRLVSGASNATP